MKIKRHILKGFLSALLLLSFACGQFIVLTHNHSGGIFRGDRSKGKTSVITEKCSICDAKDHCPMDISFSEPAEMYEALLPAETEYKELFSDFILIRSSSRSPPYTSLLLS